MELHGDPFGTFVFRGQQHGACKWRRIFCYEKQYNDQAYVSCQTCMHVIERPFSHESIPRTLRTFHILSSACHAYHRFCYCLGPPHLRACEHGVPLFSHPLPQ